MGDSFSLEDLIIILRRRFLAFLIPAVLLAPLLSIGVMLLPAWYTAKGTMLIESPQISTGENRSGKAKAMEQIELIRARLNARPQLLQIADQTELFAKNNSLSPTKRVEKMRKRFRVAPITNEIVTGRASRETLAFEIAYKDKNRYNAASVANEYMNRFEQEAKKRSVKNASDATEFFEQRTEDLIAERRAKREEIARFKQANEGRLPDQLPLQERQLERYIQQLSQIDTQIASVEEDKRFVESQIASNAAGGGSENSPESLLLTKRSELEQLRARYTDAHPEVIAVRNEVRALERQLAPGRELQRMQQELDEAEERLAKAQESGADDEEVARLSAEADALADAFLSKATAGGGLSSSAQTFLLRSRLYSLDKRGKAFEDRREGLQARIDEIEQRISDTPAVESQLSELENDLEFIEAQLTENKIRQENAQQVEDLEVQDRLERIEMIEAASVPEKPSSPNRVALIFVSLVFSVFVGALTAIGIEFLNATVRGRTHLTSLIDEPPLAVIPYIANDAEPTSRLNLKRFLPLGLGRKQAPVPGE